MWSLKYVDVNVEKIETMIVKMAFFFSEEYEAPVKYPTWSTEATDWSGVNERVKNNLPLETIMMLQSTCDQAKYMSNKNNLTFFFLFFLSSFI